MDYSALRHGCKARNIGTYDEGGHQNSALVDCEPEYAQLRQNVGNYSATYEETLDVRRTVPPWIEFVSRKPE
jgi:hypothetical protein